MRALLLFAMALWGPLTLAQTGRIPIPGAPPADAPPTTETRTCTHLLSDAPLAAYAASLADGPCAQTPPPLAVGTGGAAFADLVELSRYDYVTAAVNFNQEKVKLVIAPFAARPNPALAGLRISLARGTGDYAAGLGLTYNTASPLGARGRRIFQRNFAGIVNNPQEGALDKVTLPATFHDRLWNSYEELMEGSMSLSGAFTTTVFEEVGGREVDRDSNGVVDNRYALRGYTAQAGLAYLPQESITLGATYAYGRRRASAAADADLASYHTMNLSMSVRALMLRDAGEARRAPEFISSFFLPALYLGVAVDGEWCESGRRCADLVERRITTTPFVEARVTPTQQLRLGLSFRATRYVDGESGRAALQPLLQYLLALSPAR